MYNLRSRQVLAALELPWVTGKPRAAASFTARLTAIVTKPACLLRATAKFHLVLIDEDQSGRRYAGCHRLGGGLGVRAEPGRRCGRATRIGTRCLSADTQLTAVEPLPVAGPGGLCETAVPCRSRKVSREAGFAIQRRMQTCPKSSTYRSSCPPLVNSSRRATVDSSSRRSRPVPQVAARDRST